MKKAIISVHNKDGIFELAKFLSENKFEIYSTGGTYSYLTSKGIKVFSISDYTGFPEVLDGRVKTLHPKIFAGILADRKKSEHVEDVNKNKISLFDLVVVSLYPFVETVSKKDVKVEEAIEQIDIGGVSLIRAAAKNFDSVSVLVDNSQYDNYINEYIKTGGNISYEYRKNLAFEAFKYISEYDIAISEYFKSINSEESVPDFISLGEAIKVRYGENPHQRGYILKKDFDNIFEVLHGKEISYNNILDLDAAYSIINEFVESSPVCAIVKHGNPCGIAESEDLLSAYLKAFETDTVSPFGGIIIFNKKLDFKTSLEVDKLFTEILIAPDFDDDALEFLKKKKNRRLIKFNFAGLDTYDLRKVSGGFLYQSKDDIVFDKNKLTFVTEKKPNEEMISECEFAFKVVKHTKSNAVVFTKDRRTLGIGGGQPSRIDSTNIAIQKAKQFNLDLKDSIVASDAFFPFADSIIELAKVGVKCIIQPGGSVRDDEVIQAANENNLIMIFTGIRHFKH
ncbi:MAG: bifunctional phosphoribosylaminoimidazolecarboxamide formyltransferase/IMP cyclohydrolase [Ignavibacteria bacterium]|nr:bifunctional phosphoribosylaminoimidazolecarboxamide formyltransferase/IMP cyclohydrolase [Ignavibacteria bacterium]